MMTAGEATFGTLLRDKLAELDADEAEPEEPVNDDAVERLRLDARQNLLASQHGPLPRAGHQAYVVPPAPPEETGQRHLDLRY